MGRLGCRLGVKIVLSPSVALVFLKNYFLKKMKVQEATWVDLGPIWVAQERPRDPQGEPKSAPERSKRDPRAARAAQERSKSGPRAAKSGKRATKSDSRAAKRRPRASQNCEDGLKSGQVVPKTASDPPKGAPRGSKIVPREVTFTPRLPRRVVCITKDTPRVPGQNELANNPEKRPRST